MAKINFRGYHHYSFNQFPSDFIVKVGEETTPSRDTGIRPDTFFLFSEPAYEWKNSRSALNTKVSFNKSTIGYSVTSFTIFIRHHSVSLLEFSKENPLTQRWVIQLKRKGERDSKIADKNIKKILERKQQEGA